MKAFIVVKYGKKDILRPVEMPEPSVQDSDLLVEVHAAGVNLLDSKIRIGEFKPILPYRQPLILGHDVAGIVVRVGSKVRNFTLGDEVYARPRDGRIGTFAEYIAINEADVALKPGCSFHSAGRFDRMAGAHRQSRPEEGAESLHSGGVRWVGTFAKQLAKHLGATVATTASAASGDLVKSLGADVVVDYRKDDFEQVLSDYDVVLNSQDAKTLEKSLNVLKSGGKLISISDPPGQDRDPCRIRRDPPGRGSSLPILCDQRSPGLCRNRTRQG